MAKHMGKTDGQKLWESMQRARREEDMREVNALATVLAQKLREQPDDEAAGDATEHLQNRGNDEVHEVLPAVAVGEAGKVDVAGPVFIIRKDDVAKLFEFVEGGGSADLRDSTYPIFKNFIDAAFLPVNDLQSLKYSLLLAVESYKALLIFHAVLLVLTVIALIAMARA